MPSRAVSTLRERKFAKRFVLQKRNRSFKYICIQRNSSKFPPVLLHERQKKSDFELRGIIRDIARPDTEKIVALARPEMKNSDRLGLVEDCR